MDLPAAASRQWRKPLSERLGIVHINSDVVRKALAGKSGRQPEAYGEGIYSLPMTEKTYEKMARDAEKLITSGKGVLVDATFIQRAQRQRMASWPQSMTFRSCKFIVLLPRI